MDGSRRVLALIITALLACFVMSSGTWAAPYEVPFKSGTVLPPAQAYSLPQNAAMAVDQSRVHVFLQLENHLAVGDRARLRAQGIELLSYFPDRAYAASVPANLDLSQMPTLGVRHLSPMLMDYKLHPRVMEQAFGSWSAMSDGRRIFAVDIMSDVSLADAAALLQNLGCEVGDHLNAAHTLLAAFAPVQVYDVANVDFVLFVDEAPPPMDMVNDVTRVRLHVNEVQAAPYNLSGAGVSGLVYDGGMCDSTHPDFGDRVHWNEVAAVADHATHVSGTFGGSGLNSGGQYRGMAPNVTMISGQYDACVPYCLYESPNDFEPDYTRARNVFDIELTTNSIGANIDRNGYPCEWFGDYESTSRLLDQMVNNTAGDPLIMCFAAGNERGGASCANSSYRCMSVPAGAKNIITVGASTATDGIAGFSSWGPTDDGRVKPEVCARGDNVTSTVPGGGYEGGWAGTSMATPAVAGVVALILEKWHTMFPGAPDPLPETVKAILINSTTDIGPAGVDFQTGYGLVNALKAIDNMIAGGILESAIETGEDFTRTFTVQAGLNALDVSLAWSDLPATGNVTPTLINDLDLSLTDPSGTPYLPWRLNPNNPGGAATTGVDTINVCERVHVASPAAGTWTLHVTGTLNGAETQKFGLSANVALVTDWATITGQVRNSNQQGIPGRVFVVGGAQAVNTDATGNYLFAVPGNATYPVRAISYGFVPQTANVVVTTGSTTQNYSLTTAQNGTLNGTVLNQFGTPLAGAVVSFDFPNAAIPNDTTDATGAYGATLPGANSYGVTADYFGLAVSGVATVPEGGSATLNLTLNDPRFAPAGPDAYGYYCYEATDPGLGQAYSWFEISPAAGGPGTAITPGTGNDWVADINIPFPFRFYGQENTQLRVGADGWVGGGLVNHNNRRYVNQPIPTDSLPNGIIAVFWDDLDPAPAPGDGDLSYYHDAANGRFIIEYHNVSHYTPNTNHVTAQLIIYNLTTRPTLTNDNEFVVQYQAVDYSDNSPNDADASVGCENYQGDVGLQIVYGGTYDVTCRELAAETTLRFTTGIVTGFGAVQGQVNMIPPPSNWNNVNVQFGPYTIHPVTGGSFLLDSVIANTYAITATSAGYEVITDTITVTDDGTVTVNFELYHLDPATNLTGSYESATHTIHLNWNPPAWSDGAPPIRGGGRALDSFEGYQVWRGGQGIIATVQDTFYNYNVTQSGSYNMWVRAIYGGGTTDTTNHYRVNVDLAADDAASLVPTEFYLSQNYPNPFNPTTQIEFGLPHSAKVTLAVYDLLGRQVALLVDEVRDAGVYHETFNSTGIGTGVYYYRMQAGDFSSVRKLLILR